MPGSSSQAKPCKGEHRCAAGVADGSSVAVAIAVAVGVSVAEVVGEGDRVAVDAVDAAGWRVEVDSRAVSGVLAWQPAREKARPTATHRQAKIWRLVLIPIGIHGSKPGNINQLYLFREQKNRPQPRRCCYP